MPLGGCGSVTRQASSLGYGSSICVSHSSLLRIGVHRLSSSSSSSQYEQPVRARHSPIMACCPWSLQRPPRTRVLVERSGI